jgi:hypothetical protein
VDKGAVVSIVRGSESRGWGTRDDECSLGGVEGGADFESCL